LEERTVKLVAKAGSRWFISVLMLMTPASQTLAQGTMSGGDTPLPPYMVLGTPGQVAEVVGQAVQEVLVASDVLRSQEVANALRKAITTRGVPVYVLTFPEAAGENASYASSLSLAGAQVALSPIGGSFMVVDRRLTVAGPMVGGLGSAQTADPNALTVVIDNPDYASGFVEGFIEAFEQAEAYEPQVGRER
jgi:hypothetical protein